MAKNFTFVAALPPDAPTRLKELSKSEALSHAARAGHVKAAQKRSLARPKASGDKHLRSQKSAKKNDNALPRSPDDRPYVSNQKSLSIAQEDEEEDFFNQPTEAELTLWNQLDPQTSQLVSTKSQPGLYRPLALEIDQVNSMFWTVTFPSSEHFCKLHKTKNIFTQDFLTLLGDEAFFHVGAAFVKYEYNEAVDSSDKTPPDVLTHKMKALKVVQRRLKDSGGVLDNVTLIAMMLLPFVEDLSSSLEVSQTHWSAVSRILGGSVRQRAIDDGAHAAYTRLVMDQVSSFCLFHTGISLSDMASRGQRQHSPPQASSSAIESPPSLDSASIQDLPSGVQTLVHMELIGGPTVAMARNVESCVGADWHKHYFTPDGRPSDDGMTSSFIKNWDLFNIKPSSIPDEPSIEELLPAAIMMYSARSIGQLSITNSTSRAGRAHLSIRLPACVVRRSREEEYALFWIWTIAVECWKTRLDELPSEGVKVRDAQVVRFPWALSEEVSARVLKMFFWDDRLLQNHKRFMSSFWM